MSKFSNYYLRIRTRHPSHRPLRKNRKLLIAGAKWAIRLGSTTEKIEGIPESRILNPVSAIRTSSNKWAMKEAFEKAGVKSTKFCSVADIKKKISSKDFSFPVLAKKKFGSKGKGMVKIDDSSQLNTFLKGNTSGYYFEEFFNGSREYRLHVWNGGCFYTCRKMRKNDAKERWFFNSLNCVWIEENSPTNLFNKPSNWKEIVKDCIRAKNAVGLDTAAIDVRVSKKGDYRILETNSAPSLGESGIKAYEETLPLIIKNK